LTNCRHLAHCFPVNKAGGERVMHVIRRLLVSLLALAAFIGTACADTRVALVIGNGAYVNVPRLPNPTNDAADVAAALKQLGFQTIVATDLDKPGMDETAIRFARAARTADIALFYYSGHAIQFGGVNYLLPVDAKLVDEADLRRLIRLDDMTADLQQAKNLRILVLDSCRDNPLLNDFKRAIEPSRSASVQRGLARIDSPQGMIVAYATQAGRTAADGSGRNSPYTAAFLKYITSDDEIGTIFRRVSSDVYEKTGHNQLPELSLSLIGEFYLQGSGGTVKPNPAGADDGARRDFEAAERVDSTAGWDAYLAAHPSGFYAALARERRAKALTRVAALPAGKPETTTVAPDVSSPATGNILTIPEGLTSEQIVALLQNSNLLTGDIAQIPAEGSLLPDSYVVAPGTTRAQMIQRLQQAQQRVVADVWQHRNPALALSGPQQLATLASIVEKEASKPDERPRIAAVFVNRLRQKIKLQSDPTIIYGLVGGKGTLGRPITRSEITQATPYNTYVIDGLPPGPIENPSRESLEAAANPAPTRDLFFTDDGHGGHVFDETYEGFRKNVAKLRGTK
jgi:hypothetical protein